MQADRHPVLEDSDIGQQAVPAEQIGQSTTGDLRVLVRGSRQTNYEEAARFGDDTLRG